MTFSLFKNQTIKSEKTAYTLFTEIDKLNPSNNVDYNLIMAIEQQEPLILKFRNSRPEIQFTDPKDFSTTLFLRFTSDKDQTTITLSIKPNPLFFFLYILIAVLTLVIAIIVGSAENLFGILGIATLVFAWDSYSRLNIRRRVTAILDKVKY